jgi:hypothetical protein
MAAWTGQGVTENVPFSFVLFDSVVKFCQRWVGIHPSDLSLGKLGLGFQILKLVVTTTDSEPCTMQVRSPFAHSVYDGEKFAVVSLVILPS